MGTDLCNVGKAYHVKWHDQEKVRCGHLLETFIKGHCFTSAGAAKFGEDRQTLFQDAFNRQAGLKGAGFVHAIFTFFVKKLDSAITWENVVLNFW